MYIKYLDKIYELIYCGLVDKKVISTYYIEKTDKTFYNVSDYYAKDYSSTDPDIQDIYDVKFYIKWDSQLESVITKWHIETCDYFTDGSVRLCHEGYLPGWKIVEKGLSETYLKAEKIEGYSVEYKYVVKDGKKLDEPLVVEKEVDRQEFDELVEMYRSTNI